MILVSNPNVIALVGTFIVPVLLPVIVGLVTTKVTPGGVKASLLAALTVVTTILTQALSAWNEGVGFDLYAAIPAALASFTIAVSTHYGLWKPTGVSNAAAETGRTER